jgi:hypothetical protein
MPLLFNITTTNHKPKYLQCTAPPEGLRPAVEAPTPHVKVIQQAARAPGKLEDGLRGETQMQRQQGLVV